MRITEIELRNFRQYQTLSFSFPESKEHDLHIIVAQNGVGKTNLLNAITWCLYGKEPHLGDKDKNKGLPILNLNAIDDARHAGEVSDTVEVTIRANDDDKTITYKRKLPVRIHPSLFEEAARETFTVSISTLSGDTKVYDTTEDTRRYVDIYMPEKIREYFYFDGEQLLNYFVGTRRDKVKEAIFSVSQADILHLIHARIGSLLENKRKEAAAKAPDIKHIADKITEVEKNIEMLGNIIITLNEQIRTSKRIVDENTEFLAGEEDVEELEKQRREISIQLDELGKEKIDVMSSLYSFVRKMKIALTMYPSAKHTLELIEKKEADKALPPKIDKELLNKAIEEKICTICDHPLSEENLNHINSLIDSFQVSSDASHILVSIRNELERMIDTAKAYQVEKDKLIKAYKRNENLLKNTEKELGKIDNRIDRIPDREEVKRRYGERKDHESLIFSNTEKLGVTKEQLETEGKRLEELNKELSRSLEKDAECSKIEKQMKFAARGRGIVGKIEREMIEEIRNKMAIRTTEYFKEFIWKKNTYDKVVLGDDFEFDLLHKDGYSCVGTLGAAERCLLAMSFTLALHEVSGFNSLLFIDTPVARSSDIHRINFANVLCDVSKKKQLILTFTPDEYSHDISKVFDSIAKTNVKLVMIDEKNAEFE